MLSKSSVGRAFDTCRQGPTAKTSEGFLNREEEIALIARVQLLGDRSAADALARAHWAYVVKCALKYHRYGVSVDELIAEGQLGLMHALGTFDRARGVRFVTYAKHWVRAFILQHVLANWSIVSGGSRILRTRWFFRLRRERARLANVLGDEAAVRAELAGRLGIKPKRCGR